MILHKESVHEGYNPFRCDYCEQKFTTEDFLNTHVVNVHKGINLFFFFYCVLGFETKELLEFHVEEVHDLFQFDKTEPTLESDENVIEIENVEQSFTYATENYNNNAHDSKKNFYGKKNLGPFFINVERMRSGEHLKKWQASSKQVG